MSEETIIEGWRDAACLWAKYLGMAAVGAGILLALSACGNAAPFFAGTNAGVNNAPSWQPLYVQAPSQPTSIHCIQVRQGYQSCSAQ